MCVCVCGIHIVCNNLKLKFNIYLAPATAVEAKWRYSRLVTYTKVYIIYMYLCILKRNPLLNVTMLFFF